MQNNFQIGIHDMYMRCNKTKISLKHNRSVSQIK